MVVFVELSRSVWQDHWVPEVFGRQGATMTRQFDEADQEIWKIAGTVLTRPQQNQLSALIRNWRRSNASQRSVENVRFSEFSKQAGHQAGQWESEVGGLLASIQGATQSVDRTLLFSERALFYAQRAPFLWRNQAQVGIREILSDAMATVDSGQRLLNQETRIRAILGEVSHLLELVTQIQTQSAAHPEGSKTLARMADRFASVLEQWNAAAPRLGAVATSPRVSLSIDRFLWRIFGLGAGLIVVAGLVTVVSRLAYHRLARRYQRTGVTEKTDQKKAA